MSGILSRNLLAKAIPNPRARAEFEKLDEFLSDTSGKAASLSDVLDALVTDLGDGGKYQKATAVLDAIANLTDRVGSIEITADGAAVIRPIDGQDPASLLSRGAAYTILVGIGGKGTTLQRPAVPANTVAMYFDTTLAAGGKPIFWNGTGWVDSTGVAV